MQSQVKITCRTPSPGKKPTRILKWKYDQIRSVLLKIIPPHEPGIEFRQLSALVEKSLSPEDLKALGSVAWYTTVVKLDMEVNREIQRIPASNPQRLKLNH